MNDRENQAVEWKETWRDDYMRWLCGFANARGGVLVLGKNNQGRTTGIKDARKLLEDLPNKIRDLLGIIAEVHLVEEDGKDLLEIRVEAYHNPISYRGRYYIRSGSTLQELKGAVLDRFLLRNQGRTWDGVPLPQLSGDKLSGSAIDAFRRRALQSGRLDSAVLEEPVSQLLEKLRLMEGSYLTRATALLFTGDPEDYVTGAFVKIGYFRSEADLAYHDEVRGDLFSQVRQTLDLLYSKYLKAAISYDDIQRIETFPVPRVALREVVLNALVHKDYAGNAPVQIRAYADKLKIWNPAELPEGWTLKKLLGEHSSRPFNPSVANAFFRAGEIEAWGRGIQRIFEACSSVGTPAPLVRYEPNDLWFEFPFSEEYLALLNEPGSAKKPSRASVKTSVKTSVKILELLDNNPEMTLSQVAAQVDRTVRAVEMATAKLVKEGRLRYLGPQKGGHWEVIKK